MRVNRKRVESYISEAIKVIQQEFPSGNYPKEFRGYISSFGASLIQGHWQAAIAFFSNRAEAKKERDKTLDMILALMKRQDKAITEDNLLSYALNHPQARQRVLEHLVALKLALNIFEPVKEQGGE